MMRWRSARVPAAEISFAAEGLISSLYAATPLQILDEYAEGNTFFMLTLSESGKIIDILCQGGFDGLVNHI